jgi:hypothetical protein
MARKSRRERIRYRRMKTARHRIERTAPHSILGTLIGASAVALPFVTPTTVSGFTESPIEFLGYAADFAASGNNQEAALNARLAGESVVAGVVQNFIPIIGLAALGAGVAWAGRRYARSSTNVSRKWRVF